MKIQSSKIEEINNCATDMETLIALNERAVKDLENNTHEIGQEEVLTIIREFIRLKNDYKYIKERYIPRYLVETINNDLQQILNRKV